MPGNRTRHNDVGSPFLDIPKKFRRAKVCPDRVRLEKCLPDCGRLLLPVARTIAGRAIAKEHIVNTAHTRKMSAVRALAVGAALLAINAPIVHAAPGDGHGSDNTPPPPGQASVPTPLEISVSENPVFFLPNQTKKTINITWTPQPDSEVSVMVTEGSGGKGGVEQSDGQRNERPAEPRGNLREFLLGLGVQENT